MVEFINADEGEAHPLVLELPAGTYYWCTCGSTADPPFCDNSHLGTDFEPLPFEIGTERSVSLCNCGLTSEPPFCDCRHEG